MTPAPQRAGSSNEATGAAGTMPRAIPGARPTRPEPRPSADRPPILGVVFLLLGVTVLLVSLFVGWYAVSETSQETIGSTSYTVSATETVYLLNQQSLSFSCQGSSSCFAGGTSTGTYAQGSLTSIGGLYDGASALIVVGALLGVAAVFFCLRGGRRRAPWVNGLTLVAIVLVLLAPTLVALAQPAVLNSQGTITGSSSPSHSFFGSCSGSQCGMTVTPGTPLSGSWGPSVGWFLALVSVAPLLAGWLTIRGQRRGLSGPITPEMLL